jgi:hypothetical protein
MDGAVVLYCDEDELVSLLGVDQPTCTHLLKFLRRKYVHLVPEQTLTSTEKNYPQAHPITTSVLTVDKRRYDHDTKQLQIALLFLLYSIVSHHVVSLFFLVVDSTVSLSFGLAPFFFPF